LQVLILKGMEGGPVIGEERKGLGYTPWRREVCATY